MKSTKATDNYSSRFPLDLPRPERVDLDPDRHLIRMMLELPPNRRTNFLRVPVGDKGSGI
jgi:hypothetical protein